MTLKVNPNRMELLKLKKRLNLAKRGHKLLKEKQEELIRRLMELISKYSGKRDDIEQKLAQLLAKFMRSIFYMSEEEQKSLFFVPEDSRLSLQSEAKQLLNVKVPEFRIDKFADMIFSKGYTPADLDEQIASLKDLFANILNLAHLERALVLLAFSLKTTRRRVNALEYVFIPELESSIKYIKMRLSENERQTLTALMRVKERMNT